MATLTGFGGSSAFNNFAAFANTGIQKIAPLLPLMAVGTSATPYSTYRRFGEASGYQVPAGKRYLIVGILATTTVSQNSEIGTGHADSDVYLSASAPTNPVQNYIDFMSSTVVPKYVSCAVATPAGRYPYGIIAISSGNWHQVVFGYELDAEATSI